MTSVDADLRGGQFESGCGSEFIKYSDTQYQKQSLLQNRRWIWTESNDIDTRQDLWSGEARNHLGSSSFFLSIQNNSANKIFKK